MSASRAKRLAIAVGTVIAVVAASAVRTDAAAAKRRARSMQELLNVLGNWELPEERRIEAAQALGRERHRDAIDYMFEVTQRSEFYLTEAIVKALKEMDAHMVLVGRLQDADPNVRADAASKLFVLHDDRAADALVEAAHDGEASVRREVVAALGRVRGPRVFDALVAALTDPDPGTRGCAALGVGESGDARAARLLLDARGKEQDDVAKDFIDDALRTLPRYAAPTPK